MSKLKAEDFVSEPSVDNAGYLKGASGAITDHTVQGVFQTEPIYSVTKESVQGVMNFKIYDQMSGHMVNNTPKYSSSGSGSGNIKVIQESGKAYQSGKTYYLGFVTAAKITH